MVWLKCKWSGVGQENSNQGEGLLFFFFFFLAVLIIVIFNNDNGNLEQSTRIMPHNIRHSHKQHTPANKSISICMYVYMHICMMNKRLQTPA